MPGILANVDYEEPLTKYRIREVLIEARRRSISYIDKMKQEVLADSFYVHYRQPILRMPTENEDMETAYGGLWSPHTLGVRPIMTYRG
ncbi:hypothetical protein [Vulcanisaeta sp. JCM 14467]|uniref:hypothetical protein n=1 Tax=Vulcanisaeta sp. JCM 14467 TaxID=1295370 RepID=UPI000AE6DE6A|nr:hypothetical protein [Vulcanisaeta sp. JCM 14467]